MDQLLTGHCL